MIRRKMFAALLLSEHNQVLTKGHAFLVEMQEERHLRRRGVVSAQKLRFFCFVWKAQD